MQEDFNPVGEVFFALCKAVDTPVALGAWLRFKYSQIELARMEINPRDYTSASSFYPDYIVTSYLSKYKGLETGLDQEAEALQKFTQSEEQCRQTNLRLKAIATAPSGQLHSVIHVAQRKIAKLLGVYSTFAVSESYGWGPGASVDIPRRRAFLDTKMCELPISVTSSARAMLRNEIECDLHWSASILGQIPEGPFCLMESVFCITDACRIDTVPKNAKTHRVIAVEARGNSFLQKGFGAFIRDRLRRVGINLNDQGKNQSLARLASDLSLSTLDLKAASDTVSKELVYMLLPFEWAAAMDAIRSRWASLPDGTQLRLEKFSSMGNGFTFELETLIFWAVCSAVDEVRGEYGVVSVYGDDIIVNRAIADDVVSALAFMGFTTNKEKSYIDGQFFESCGEHYFDGIRVTPAYQKEIPTESSPLSWVRLSNRLIRLAFQLGGKRFLDSRLEAAWRASYRMGLFNHDCWRTRMSLDERRWQIPFGSSGDDGFLLPYSEFKFPRVSYVANQQRRTISSDYGILCRVGKLEQDSFPANESALLAWSLRRGGGTDFRGQVSRATQSSQLGISSEWDSPEEEKFYKVSDASRWIIPSGEFSVRWAKSPA